MAFKPRASERYSFSSFFSVFFLSNSLIAWIFFHACRPRSCSLFCLLEACCSFGCCIVISFRAFSLLQMTQSHTYQSTPNRLIAAELKMLVMQPLYLL